MRKHRYSRGVIGAEPLAGRDGELGVIRRALSGTGNHAGVVIAGAAGVGKTWLAREVLRRAEAFGERTKWIVGTESAHALPLGAFIGALGEAMSDPLTNVRRVINSFVAQQRRGRVVVGVDDAHLLDRFSALVVHQLAHSGGVRLVVTVRTGGAEPDAVTALWKDGLLARLDLEPLSAAATREVIERTVGGPVDARSAARFQQLTGGNTLFLRQLLADQVAAGRMRRSAGVWVWEGDVAVSASLSDTVGRQMGRLSPETAMVVDMLSQCEPLAVDVLCDLVGRSDLAAAERMGLVNVERTGGGLMARLAHPLFGELRRASAGEMYLSEIRGRLATRLAEDGDGDMQATVRRALLHLESDLDPDPELYLESARHAMTLLDLDLADRLATAATRAGAPGAAGVRAMNLVLLGRGEQAEAALREMADGDLPDGHHWATVRAANLIWMLGKPQDAAAILDGLASKFQAPETPAQVAERLAVQACLDAVSARCEVAAEKARAALDSEGLPDFHAMMASVALIMAMGALGVVDELADVAEQALRRATTSFQASHMRFWFAAVYGRACRLTGRIDEFVGMANRLADSALDIPGLAYANLASLLGNAALARGAVAEAARLMHEALAGVHIHSVTTGLRPASYFALAEAHAKLGQPTEADDAAAQARSCVPLRLSVHAYRLVACRRVGDGGKRMFGGGGGDARRRRHDLPATAANPPTSWPASRPRPNGAMPRRWHGHRSWPERCRCPWPMPLRCMRRPCSPGTVRACWRPRPPTGGSVIGSPPPTRRRRLPLPSPRASSVSVGCMPRRWQRSWSTTVVVCVRRHCGLRRVLNCRVASAMSSSSSRRVCPTARSPRSW